MAKKKIVVAIEHADGTAGVFADKRGRLRLSGYLEDRGGTRLEGYTPALEGLDEDRLVHGGRLPPGATGAVIVDAAGDEHAAVAGDGAWVAITDDAPSIFADFPVRFTADDGEVIAPPRDPERRLDPVDDAIDDCAACGTRDWAATTHGSVVCRRCGYEVGLGAFVVGEVQGDPDPEVVARDMRSIEKLEKRERREDQRALKGVRFPVYVVRGRPAELEGWGSSGEKTTHVKVSHRTRDDGAWVRVESRREKSFLHEHEAAAARAALEMLGYTRGNERSPMLSAPALAVRLETHRRDAMRAAARATLTTLSLEVDGKPITFTVAGSGDGWAAVARPTDDTQITLTARGDPVDDIELVALDDPLSLLPPQARP